MTRKQLNQLAEENDTTLLMVDGHDNAIIGIDSDLRLVYDTDKIIKNLKKQGMSYDEALEFFNFNIGGAFVGEKTPIYISLFK